MRSSFSFLCTTILLIAVLASCTIEKRLYQPGYHVEWNKRLHSVSETEPLTEKQLSDQLIHADKQHSETILATPTSEATTKARVLSETISQTQDRVLNTSESATVTNTTNSDQQTKPLNETLERKSTLEKASNRPGSPSSSPFKRGLMFILIGLLLVGAGFLFSSATGPLGTVFLILIVLVGLIIITVGLFIMTFG
ncbi:MAG: hypothetical protein QE487_10335 [Fluviicola sp.]|nr:hypothetical protein [Fluviicola sp.]